MARSCCEPIRVGVWVSRRRRCWRRRAGPAAARPRTARRRSTSALIAENALTANALTANALTANSLTANALTANALTANSLTANALTANGLRDPLGREFLKYVVSCALDDGRRGLVQGRRRASTRSPARLGLAPEWGKKNGVCDGSCQRWVSACVLARVDAAGVKREISIRGAQLGAAPRLARAARLSGARGDLLRKRVHQGAARFLCLSPGQTDDERVCGDSLASCPMTVVGSCDDACALRGAVRRLQNCSDAGRGPARQHLRRKRHGLPAEVAHVIGSVVAGRFQLEAEAGAGGMGTVYRARDLERRGRRSPSRS